MTAITPLQKEQLRLKIMQELGSNFDYFDFDAEIDSNLTLQENENIIYEKIQGLIGYDFTTNKEKLQLENLSRLNNKKQEVIKQIVQDIRIAYICGNSGSGKSALSYKLLGYFKKEVYIYLPPKPDLVQALGYKVLWDIGKLNRITNSVIYIDEPQLYFNRGDNKQNDFFLRLCSIARHNDLTLIFSTSDTRWVNKGLESYITHWFIKNIDLNLIKNGSAIKKIVRNTLMLCQDDLNLEKNEYILYNKIKPEYNGITTFNKPLFYNEDFSKCYKNK